MSIIRSILGWSTLAVVGALALLIMLITPGLRRRRWLARLTARAALAAGGVRLLVRFGTGETAGSPREHRQALEAAVPANCVIVANHASYLDGVVLTALLPPRCGFVIKKEMNRVPIAGALLRRIGSEFVDRFDRHRSAMDARRVLRRASEGHALVFFPEGTFSREPGLLRFHSGAFVTSVRAGCPVVPMVIHGARRAFNHHRLLITPGAVQVQILQPLSAAAGNTNAVPRLRDEVRGRMLAALGQPDLASHVAPVLPADFV